ncbi:uncharacterized protein LOC135433114 [Drosophila montana]|uniref:uncharacterized protein LOC135433114 n=1 Tax=Drosophila montana TaxID=40370 RepID=UPI00313C7BEC
MSRRCVVCGMEIAEDVIDHECHYPKNIKEARIWQQSMAAFETSVESILKCCCVCIEHIPQFVERTQKQAALIKDKYGKEIHETLTPGPCPSRPSLHVLLLPGATLPPYCGTCIDPENGEDQAEEDEEIYVRESCYKDCGASFPDIDETQVTVLRTPMHNDEELKKLEKSNKECGDIGTLRNCTDVLLLGRSQNHPTDKCPCKCEQCSKTKFAPVELPGCPDQSPCSAECGSQMRQELSAIIKQQQERIYELENLISRQDDWYMSLQQKISDLYSDFGSRDKTVSFGVNVGDSVQGNAQRRPTDVQSEQAITPKSQKSSKNSILKPESSK